MQQIATQQSQFNLSFLFLFYFQILVQKSRPSLLIFSHFSSWWWQKTWKCSSDQRSFVPFSSPKLCSVLIEAKFDQQKKWPTKQLLLWRWMGSLDATAAVCLPAKDKTFCCCCWFWSFSLFAVWSCVAVVFLFSEVKWRRGFPTLSRWCLSLISGNLKPV